MNYDFLEFEEFIWLKNKYIKNVGLQVTNINEQLYRWQFNMADMEFDVVTVNTSQVVFI